MKHKLTQQELENELKVMPVMSDEDIDFSDIPKTDSFARTASRFVDLGILKAQGKFRPNDIVTK